LNECIHSCAASVSLSLAEQHCDDGRQDDGGHGDYGEGGRVAPVVKVAKAPGRVIVVRPKLEKKI
jgi:hypothetical protein